MMSVILGIGALVTGYYGMNIPRLATMLMHGAVSICRRLVKTGIAYSRHSDLRVADQPEISKANPVSPTLLHQPFADLNECIVFYF
jgi:hypothetical protein